MTDQEIEVRMTALSFSTLLPPFDPYKIAECLIDEIKTLPGQIPEQTVMLLLSIAAVLKREHVRSIAVDLQTAQVINKARLGKGSV